MSTIPVTPDVPQARRVRHQAREAATLMVFSAAVSAGFATALMLLASLGHRA